MIHDRSTRNSAGVSLALTIYTLLLLTLTAVSWSVYARNHDPFLRPLFDHYDRLHDLTNYYNATGTLHHHAAILGAGPPLYNYPAPAAFVYKALLHSVPHLPVLPFFVILLATSFSLALLALRSCSNRGPAGVAAAAAILATAFFSQPLWFDLDRGNIEGISWALTAAGLGLFLGLRYRASAVFIGLAAAVKPYPILFLLLFVGRRKFKEALLGVATSVLVTIAALIWLGSNPLRAYQQLQPGVQRFLLNYVQNILPANEARFDHSLLGAMKSAALIYRAGTTDQRTVLRLLDLRRTMPGGWPIAHTLAHIYPFVVVVALGLLFVVFRKQPLLNQLTAIAVAITLLPPLSGEYTLLSLYVPFGAWVVWLVREAASGQATARRASMLAMAVLYALLLAPATLLGLYNGNAKMFLLIALLIVTARAPMPSAYFGDMVPAADDEVQAPLSV